MTITESVKRQIQLGIEGKNQGFTTGLEKLDLITGGIIHGRYIVLTSNPGGGKYINHFKFWFWKNYKYVYTSISNDISINYEKRRKIRNY